jgi:hypothetical protein
MQDLLIQKREFHAVVGRFTVKVFIVKHGFIH